MSRSPRADPARSLYCRLVLWINTSLWGFALVYRLFYVVYLWAIVSRAMGNSFVISRFEFERAHRDSCVVPSSWLVAVVRVVETSWRTSTEKPNRSNISRILACFSFFSALRWYPVLRRREECKWVLQSSIPLVYITSSRCIMIHSVYHYLAVK